MEPVTHVLTGACLARTGFNRRAAYATVTMAIAAELPDIDVLWKVRGPVESFAHHRGITHTFLGLPVEAGILVAAVYGFHRWRLARSKASSSPHTTPISKLNAAPVRWGWLYLGALVALLSHLLLDYTNNYGIRPFYPFNGHWFAASIVFIFDPVIFALLLVALVLPPLFGLINAEVGGKRQRFRGRGMAIGALVGIVALWTFRYVQHSRAEEIAFAQTYEQQMLPVSLPDAGRGPIPPLPPIAAKPSSDFSSDKGDAPTDARDNPATEDAELVQPPAKLLQVQRVALSPDPINPFHWSAAMDYGPLYQLATVDTRSGAISPDQVTYPKMADDAVLRAASASPLGRTYLDWSSMPILSEEQPANAPRPGTRPVTRVLFRDPRFMGDVSWLRLTDRVPLTAVVTVDDNGHVVRQTMDGSSEPAGRSAPPDVHWSLAALGSASSERHVSHHVVTSPMAAAENQPVATLTQPTAAPAQPAATPAQPKAALSEPAAPTLSVASPSAVKSPPPVTKTEPIAPVVTPSPAPALAPPPPVPAPKPVATNPPSSGKTEPGLFERAYDGAVLRVHRVQAWLHWLTNPR
jgi:inner membrane protein